MVKFNEKIQKRFDEMSGDGRLYRVVLTGQEIWDLYLKSFSKEDDPIFRDPLSSVHNCNHCKNFIRRYGNIVSIDENFKIKTMFDVDGGDEYGDVVKAMTKKIKSSKVTEVFFETFKELNSLPYESCSKSNSKFLLGTPSNIKRYNKEESEIYGVVSENQIITFDHFNLRIDKKFVDTTDNSVESIMGNYRDNKNVFQRGMEEISLDTLKLVRDLINQGSIFNGDANLEKVVAMIPLKEQYDELAKNKRDNWCWVKSFGFGLSKFRNSLIGVLCVDLATGVDLNKACSDWNRRVDPKNYMKATAPITTKQVEDAKKFVTENGYEESFNRRLATLEDIKISEVLHSNVGDDKVKTVSIFDNVKSTSTRHKKSEFDKVEEVGIEKFMKDILPTCTSVQAFVDNSHSGNFVTMTTTVDEDSKPIFKWDNNYSWTFNGNLAGKSQIKQAVKSVGGKVDGVLRYSITWNENGDDILDFDAHAKEPNGSHIYFSSYKGPRGKTLMSGNLDVDMINPRGLGVENIVWTNKELMKKGVYKFIIHNFSGEKNKGFKAEIEFEGETYNYVYEGNVQGYMDVAYVTLKDGVFTIEHKIPEIEGSSKEIYGIETNNFHKVNLICLSPNHWGENNSGNKHYLFMIDGCVSPTSVRSFHNENLLPELAEHRKVLEVLSATNMVESTPKQLSGLGFNSTVRDEVILKLEGSHKRVVKIKF